MSIIKRTNLEPMHCNMKHFSFYLFGTKYERYTYLNKEEVLLFLSNFNEDVDLLSYSDVKAPVLDLFSTSIVILTTCLNKRSIKIKPYRRRYRYSDFSVRDYKRINNLYFLEDDISIFEQYFTLKK